MFLVLAPNCWGKSVTEDGALKVARKSDPARQRKPFKTYKVFLVPSDAYVDEMGCIRWHDAEDVCIQLKFVKDGKVQKPVAKDSESGVEPNTVKEIAG